jgi:hypothetical protein
MEISAVRRFTDNHPDIATILRKPPIDRTSDEKKSLFKVMRPLKAFQKISDFTLGEVVGSLVLLEMEPNRAVFKQGMQLYLRLQELYLTQIKATLEPRGILFFLAPSRFKSRDLGGSKTQLKSYNYMTGITHPMAI